MGNYIVTTLGGESCPQELAGSAIAGVVICSLVGVVVLVFAAKRRICMANDPVHHRTRVIMQWYLCQR